MQRILLCLLFFFPISAANFTGFIAIAFVDKLTGGVKKILLEPKKTFFIDQFKIYINTIEADEEALDVAWVDLKIYYRQSKNDVPVCVQQGKLSTKQMYHLPNDRHLIGFYILHYTGVRNIEN